MTVYIALLRSVNVGGTGKLPMTVLKGLCQKAGYGSVQTYIASGNVILESEEREEKIKATLEDAIERRIGKRISVFVRTATEMKAVLARNPFPGKEPGKTVAVFLDTRPRADVLAKPAGRNKEEIRAGKREIYIYYPDGIGRSKLRFPAADSGTARNMNTVARLVELTSQA
jgi:uncharacterized protein (DUF1697 family)